MSTFANNNKYRLDVVPIPSLNLEVEEVSISLKFSIFKLTCLSSTCLCVLRGFFDFKLSAWKRFISHSYRRTTSPVRVARALALIRRCAECDWAVLLQQAWHSFLPFRLSSSPLPQKVSTVKAGLLLTNTENMLVYFTKLDSTWRGAPAVQFCAGHGWHGNQWVAKRKWHTPCTEETEIQSLTTDWLGRVSNWTKVFTDIGSTYLLSLQ